jgi:hypothetical protein
MGCGTESDPLNGQRDSQESGPIFRGSNPNSWSLMTTLATPSHTIASPSTFATARKTASYSGDTEQEIRLSRTLDEGSPSVRPRILE